MAVGIGNQPAIAKLLQCAIGENILKLANSYAKQHVECGYWVNGGWLELVS